MASSPGSVISTPQKPSHLKCGLQRLKTKGLKSENLRDNTPGNELTNNQLAELTQRRFLGKRSQMRQTQRRKARTSQGEAEKSPEAQGKHLKSLHKQMPLSPKTPITKSTASQNRGIPGNQRKQKQQVNVDLSGTRERLSDASTSLLNASFDPRTGTNHRQKSTNFRYSLSRSSSISRRLLLLEAFWPSLEV